MESPAGDPARKLGEPEIGPHGPAPTWAIGLGLAGAAIVVGLLVAAALGLFRPDHLGAAQAAFRAGDHAAAERLYRLAIGQGGHPRRMARAYQGLGLSLLRQGRHAEARGPLGLAALAYEDLHQDDPTDGATRVGLDDARRALEEARAGAEY